MRDLHSELRSLGLTSSNCDEILEWINTLTVYDLIVNGNLNVVPPAGDSDYCQAEPITNDPVQEYLVKNCGSCGKIQLTSNIAKNLIYH